MENTFNDDVHCITAVADVEISVASKFLAKNGGDVINALYDLESKGYSVNFESNLLE